jgi:glutathione S-transferase
VGGAFSFADIAMATALQLTVPVADGYVALGPATRAAWADDALAAEFADLVAWRDALYARHRRT